MKNIFRFLILNIILSLIVGQLYAADPATKWVQGTNLYEIYVKQYTPTHNLKGVTSHLGDLQAMGTKTIWLMPIFLSPSDHGYDAIDYFMIDPRYGTEKDLKDLVTQAHAKGINILLDLAVDHCSNLNPIFNSQDGSKRKDDWFMWRSSDQGWPKPWDNTNDFCPNSTWFKDPTSFNRGFFYTVFGSDMPNFNYTDTTSRTYVVNYFCTVMQYWISHCDIDGFRCDAVRYLVANGRNTLTTSPQRDQPQTHDVWKQFRKQLDGMKPSTMIVAEATCNSEEELLAYYGSTDEFNGAFHFCSFPNILLNTVLYDTRYKDLLPNLQKIQDNLPCYKNPKPQEWNQDFLFLSNHDGGFNPRPGTYFNGFTPKLKLVASLYILIPGAPTTYYGEEIGMKNDTSKPNPDDQVRNPMDWTEYNKQKKDPDSILNHYTTLLNLRNRNDALSKGIAYFVPTIYEDGAGNTHYDNHQYDGSNVMSIIREYYGNMALVVFNFTNGPFQYYVDFAHCGLIVTGRTPEVLMGSTGRDTYTPITKSDSKYYIGRIQPYSVAVLNLKPKTQDNN